MLPTELQQIVDATHHDPFSVLGRHPEDNRVVVRVYRPHAEEITIAEGNLCLRRVEDSDFFEWIGEPDSVPDRYRLIWRDDEHREHIAHDPYCYPPQLSDFDLHLFGEGKHRHCHRFLGSRVHETDGTAGVLFSVWAPNAERVSVVGDFNHWDGRVNPMRTHGTGVWELFMPDLPPGALYKFEIRSKNGSILLKSDPFARRFEVRPSTASIVEPPSLFEWNDDAWLSHREQFDWLHEPMSIYEVHLGSWLRGAEGELLNYRELARKLVEHVLEMGFSHIELMPITEHPYDLSWGYQATGYYAPTSRFGTPDDFRWLINHCHENGLGVILDWVPAHFPKDAHGLARFDGTALFEHEDPRLGEHLDWSTLIFNFGRYEVKNFLISSALFWLEEFHVDGLRVDAVASMLYLDYSREDWVPNRHGGRENLDAIDFMRELNEVTHELAPGALVMAEESTAWSQVTKPTYVGGLGFDMKWNMGWMNDTLRYMEKDPLFRQYHQDMLTFSMLYAFTENFLLPFSHDEVTHGKKSMLYKMPGDEWQRFANLRLLYTYMFTHPGKKLLFMGCEFGQGEEWNSTAALDWYVLQYPLHEGIKNLVKDLNAIYKNTLPLHRHDFDWHGFEWIDCHDAHNSVLVYQRRADDRFVIVALNFTPIPREGYRIGVPEPGHYREILNSDARAYEGSGLGNGARTLESEAHPWMNKPQSLVVTLPPLAGIVIELADRPAQLPGTAREPTDTPRNDTDNDVTSQKTAVSHEKGLAD